ncbi:alpha/beta-hydrolase [Lentithecium fluviatile CBS 122367]|uniref:Kynurenine formamidase n=1 Tax=Lentithecium fluviatile CBS 122367 TaxID=1168545 RepID=A0A6G1JLE6_9PLEO|nr:alpha/beta-hydrolase [Lentithecium fluviatile CBS 122367]
MASPSPSSSLHYPLYGDSVPYTTPSTPLQTLDLWLPRPPSQSDPDNTIWVIYIHGGAWRDPTQNSKCVQPMRQHLERWYPADIQRIAGMASINYRLSPYPNHPTLPSMPEDPQRNAKHPDHVQDVYRAIVYLKREYGIKRWMGVGHSCGATLLLQYVVGIGLTQPLPTLPEALVVLEGIYSVPLLLRNHQPPSCPENISRIYHDFIQGAFGDASTYDVVSPVSGLYSEAVWPGAKLLVLGYSAEDELVEAEQREVMLKRLKDEGWEKEGKGDGKRVAVTWDLNGGHDEIWEDGIQIAELISEVVRRLLLS